MVNPVVVNGRCIVERREGNTYEGLTWQSSDLKLTESRYLTDQGRKR